MITCAKCGKANLPTRKYCLRCGASLISAPEPEPEKPAPAQKPVAPATPSSKVSATTDDKWVRPSEVSKDRVRTSAPKMKSELEKAREAFARAEEVGIEEGDEGIVETRMLRASEVRELLESAAEYEAQAPPMPTQPETIEPGAPPQPAAPAIPTPKDLEEGILGSQSSLVEKPAPPVTPAPPPETSGPPGGPPATAAPTPPGGPPAPAPPTAPAAPAAPAPKPKPPTPKAKPTPTTPAPTPVAAPPPSVPIAQQVIPEVEVIEMKISDPEYLKDKKIGSTLTDLRHLHLELKQANADLAAVAAHLENDVQNCRNSTEVKRIHYESIQEQARLAKEEWTAAEKEYHAAQDRQKKEMSTRQKRIDKIQKNISKAESTVEKRVRDLDKEKEKQAAQEKS